MQYSEFKRLMGWDIEPEEKQKVKKGDEDLNAVYMVNFFDSD